MVAGFASSGVVAPWLGFTAAFLVDAVSFLACAGAVAWLPGVTRTAEPIADGEPGERKGVFGTATALTAVPVLGLMVCLRGIDALGSSSHNAALPVYSSALDPDDPAAFVSRFWLFWALGNALAQQVLQRWTKRTGRSVGALGFGLGTVVMSSAFILGFDRFPMAAPIGSAPAAGAADGLTEVSYTSHLQTLPETLRGHAFGLSATVENLGFGLGMIAVSAALESFSALTVVAWSHRVAIVVAGIYLLRLYALRGADAEGASGASIDRRDGAGVSGS
ncbi:MFS transporter [Streptomyces sp. NPDC001530]|uniref:MFS transporter n=1 Tax=Streptomyces sp. NPDC001530 TaxID=3364582 RepID=UPI00368087B4